MSLTRDELIALAAGARAMIMADRELSAGEADLSARFASRLGLTDAQWREAWNASVRADGLRVASEITRPAARETIYELLYELATDGSITDPEWDLLEALDEAWQSHD